MPRKCQHQHPLKCSWPWPCWTHAICMLDVQGLHCLRLVMNSSVLPYFLCRCRCCQTYMLYWACCFPPAVFACHRTSGCCPSPNAVTCALKMLCLLPLVMPEHCVPQVSLVARGSFRLHLQPSPRGLSMAFSLQSGQHAAPVQEAVATTTVSSSLPPAAGT